MRLGIIARADKTGLGNQTRNLVHMLKPAKVLVIDSTPFNGNEQFPDTYNGYNIISSRGFPRNMQVLGFLNGLDAVLTCELFYHPGLVKMARQRGIRTYNQFNYEFLDNLANPNMPIPTKFLAPSRWYLEEMKTMFTNTEYLPPPTSSEAYKAIRDHNMKRSGKRRFLHIVGREAVHDRNGTLDLLRSLRYNESDFELVVKAQKTFTKLDQFKDPRIVFDSSSPLMETELYRDFDALILPRRFAGLCLPMNEALMSGLPVIMTDISPNNKVLPKEWLAQSTKSGSFTARTEIDLYSADDKDLSSKIDWLCATDIKAQKKKAFKIGYDNYSEEVLLPKYKKVLGYEANL